MTSGGVGRRREVQSIDSTSGYDLSQGGESRPHAPQASTVAAVSRLSGLRRLGINGRGLRDTDLVPLAALTKLSELVLSGDRATDAGLEHVNGRLSLHKLVLVNSNATDLGLPQLNSLKNLSE